MKRKNTMLALVMAALLLLLSPLKSFASGETYNCTVTYTLNATEKYIELVDGGLTTEKDGAFQQAVIRIYDAAGQQIGFTEATVTDGKAVCTFENLTTKPTSAKCTLLSNSTIVKNGYIEDTTNSIKGEIVLTVDTKSTSTSNTASTRQSNTKSKNTANQPEVITVNMTYKSDIYTTSGFYKPDFDFIKIAEVQNSNGKRMTLGQNDGIVEPINRSGYVWFHSVKTGSTTIKVKYLVKDNTPRVNDYKTVVYKVNVKAVGKEAYTKYFQAATGPVWNKKIKKLTVSIPRNYRLGDKKCPKAKWSKVKGATGYEVYRKGNASGYWIKIGDVKKGTSLKLDEIQKGYKVAIKVRPYKEKNGVKYFGKFTSKTNNVKKFKMGFYASRKGLEQRFTSEITFIEMNKERTKKGHAKLKWSEELYRMALAHAEYNYKHSIMIGMHHMKETYKYTPPTLKSKEELDDACGLWLIDNKSENIYATPSVYNDMGENCAYGITSAASFRNCIRKSPRHYATAMSENYKYSTVAKYGGYVVQRFGQYRCYKSN